MPLTATTPALTAGTNENTDLLDYLRERSWNRTAQPTTAWTDAIEMVHRLAKRRFYGTAENSLLDIDDLVQEGLIALLHAADLYDDTSGVPFEAYAKQKIWYAFQNATRDTGLLNQRDQVILRKLQHARREIHAHDPNHASYHDLAKVTGIPVAKATAVLAAEQRTYAIPLGTVPEWAHPADRTEPLPDETGPDPIDTLRLSRALAGMSVRDRDITLARYVHGLTIAEIANQFMLSPTRVFQIVNSSLERLQAAFADDSPG